MPLPNEKELKWGGGIRRKAPERTEGWRPPPAEITEAQGPGGRSGEKKPPLLRELKKKGGAPEQINKIFYSVWCFFYFTFPPCEWVEVRCTPYSFT
jgi:hypothetical protein